MYKQDDFFKPNEKDVDVVNRMCIFISVISVEEKYRIVYKDYNCVLFNKQYIEHKNTILKEQINFTLMLHYRYTAELILKKMFN